jgi:Bacterial SH3 domain
MAYIECPQCGHRALSVATRCPRCGHSFPIELIRHPVSEPQLHKLWPVLVVAAVLVTVMVVVDRRQAGPSAITAPPATAVLKTAPSIPVPSVHDTPPSPGDSSRQVEPPRSGVPPLGGQWVQRFATTWVNVREARRFGTPAVRVLNPGEAVLVDSLRGGWYRVVVEGRTLGYVDRLYLDTVPPPDHP